MNLFSDELIETRGEMSLNTVMTKTVGEVFCRNITASPWLSGSVVEVHTLTTMT